MPALPDHVIESVREQIVALLLAEQPACDFAKVSAVIAIDGSECGGLCQAEALGFATEAPVGSLKPILQGGDGLLAPDLDLVFHGNDVLPLTPLSGFGLAVVLRQALSALQTECPARLALQPFELQLGVFERL